MSKARRRKNQNRQTHPIDEMMRFQYRWVREFSVVYPDIWGAIGSGINIVQMTQWMIGHQPDPSMVEVHRLVMWQTVLDYQIQSIILILQHKLDSGLALLRMAAELSRDVYVIGSDQARMDLWMEKEKQRREYQEIFKFDKSFPPAKIVHDIYKLCSKFGVHGHVSNNVFSELKGRAGKDGQLALLDVSQIGIVESVGTWLMGFAPMHHLCSNEFFTSQPAELFKEFSDWHEFELSFMELVQLFHASLNELKQESRSE